MVDAADHRHCKVCGKVCSPGSDTCSNACATRREQMLSTRRTYTYLLYGTIALVVILFLASYR